MKFEDFKKEFDEALAAISDDELIAQFEALGCKIYIGMKPEIKIKKTILLQNQSPDTYVLDDVPLDTEDEIAEAYEQYEDWLQDAEYEFREGEVETNLRSEYSRHYESKSVAAQMFDDSWVGWTYWYGGGKHGEPEAIDWMSDAYNLDCEEEEKMVLVRTFKKI